MAMIAPATQVAAAQRTPLSYGLFSVFAPRPDAQERWRNGIAWETLTCEPVLGLGAPDCDPGQIIGLPKDLSRLDREDGEASPFTVYGHHQCSPIGTPAELAQSLANQHLINREEARVEQALWTGDLGNIPNFAGANGYGAPDNAGSVAANAAWSGVAKLEQYSAVHFGSQGVIHMSRYWATMLADDGDLRFTNGRAFTPLGTPVVAGAGYGDDKLVFTPPLFGYRSEILSSSDRPYDLLDRGQNNLYAIAERQYVIGFDPCGLAAVTIT